MENITDRFGGRSAHGMSIRNETRWLLFPASALVLSRPELIRIYHGIADISVLDEAEKFSLRSSSSISRKRKRIYKNATGEGKEKGKGRQDSDNSRRRGSIIKKDPSEGW